MRHHLAEFCALLLIPFLTSSLNSQECINHPEYIHWVGSAETSRSVFCIDVIDSHVFLGGADRFIVVDVSVPDSFVEIGSVDIPEYCQGVDVVDGIAYLAVGYSGLIVVDVQQPNEPSIIGGYDTVGYANDVEVVDSIAYIADFEPGVFIASVADPANPDSLFCIDTPGIATAIAVSDSLAYVAGEGAGGCTIVSVADPASPYILGNWSSNSTQSIVVAGQYAYLTTGYTNPGFLVIDVSDPGSPFLVGSHSTIGYAYDVDVLEGFAYVAAYDGFNVFDVSDPYTPLLTGSIDIVDALGVSVDGEWAYCASGGQGSGLNVFNTGNSYGVEYVSSMELSNAYDFASVEDVIYVVDGNLTIIDISVPDEPIQVSTIPTVGDSRGILVHESYVLITGSDLLEIFDVSSPGNPIAVATTTFDGDVSSHYPIVNDKIISPSARGIEVVDISDPEHPVNIGNFESGSISGNYVAAIGQDIILGASGQVVTISLEDPAFPDLLGGIELPTDLGVTCIKVLGSYAYVLSGYDEYAYVHVLDLTSVTSPIYAGALRLPMQAYSMEVVGDTAYIGCANYYDHPYNRGVVQIVDLSAPPNMTHIGTISLHDNPTDIVARGEYIYTNTVYDNFRVSLRQCGTAVFYSANPWVGYGSVAFQESSWGSPEYWFWEFGNGDYSTEQNPNYYYDIPGEYSVTLTATGTEGIHTLTKKNCIKILPPQVSAEFYCSTYEGQPPLPVEFVNGSTGAPIDSFRWDFGDGVVSGDYRPTHTYQAAGDYNVTLTAYGPENTDEASRLVVVREEKPVIVSISDVPEDQGGRVYVEFLRSIHDDQPLRDRDPICMYTVQRNDNDVWVSLFSVGGYGEPYYAVEATTLADSTAEGSGMTEYRVIAITWEGNFASDSFWGYSVDNIAPGVPEGFVVIYQAEGNELHWDQCSDEDFQYFKVYRGDTEDFDVSEEVLVHQTIDTSWVDAGFGYGWYYKISAVDHAGNEGEATGPGVVTDVADPLLPQGYALLPCVPNPFNPSTTITFSLPEDSEVSLSVFDLSGRKIVDLIPTTPLSRGYYEVRWEGTDSSGHVVASGVYLYSLKAKEFLETRKMTLLK